MKKTIIAGFIALTAVLGVATYVPGLTAVAAPIDEVQKGVNAAGGAMKKRTPSARGSKIS